MKKTALVMALLTAFAGVASAQSSVTLSGTVDVNVRSVKNGDGGTARTMGTDGLSSSNFALKGMEDLGGGMQAGFWLEAPIAPDAGTANATRFWNRRATVSLISASAGEVRLGRDLTPNYRAWLAYDPFTNNGLESVGPSSNMSLVSALGSGSLTATRADNSVGYFLPKMGGIYGQVMVSAAETVVGAQHTGGRIGYAAGPLDTSVAYGQNEVAADNDYTQLLFGASYDFGGFKLLGQWVESRYDVSGGEDRKQRVIEIGATMPVGQGLFKAAYMRSDMKSGTTAPYRNADDADLFALGYVHNLSKRTALYGNFVSLKNKGGSMLVLASVPTGIGAEDRSTGAEFGIRHSF